MTCHALEQVEGSAEDDPFNTVLVAFTKCLPNCLFLRGLARDRDSGSPATLAWRVLLDFAKFDSLRWNKMSSVGEIEHAPEGCIGIWLGDLEKWEIGRVWRGKRELVDGRHHTGVGNGPFQVTRGFTSHDTRRRCRVAWVGDGRFGAIPGRRK